MLKLTLILSNLDKVPAFEEFAVRIDRSEFSIRFLLLNRGPSHIESFLKAKGIPVTRIRYRGRRDLVFAFFQTLFALNKDRPDIVHTHLFDASLIGLLAAKILRVKKRIHTRHHVVEHHDKFFIWRMADSFISWLSTTIVSPSRNVSEVLSRIEKVDEPKIALVEHGFDLSNFESVSQERIERIRQKYRLNSSGPVIGVISRFVDWKGIQFIVPAFLKLLKSRPEAKFVFANATISERNPIYQQLRTLPEESVRLIAFENDNAALFKTFDVFVHAPIDPYVEAFGQIYVEALAAGTPSVFTLSGIAKDFVEHRTNALTVDFQNSEMIYEAVQELLNSPPLIESLRQQGPLSTKRFDMQKHMNALKEVYVR